MYIHKHVLLINMRLYTQLNHTNTTHTHTHRRACVQRGTLLNVVLLGSRVMFAVVSSEVDSRSYMLDIHLREAGSRPPSASLLWFTLSAQQVAFVIETKFSVLNGGL